MKMDRVGSADTWNMCIYSSNRLCTEGQITDLNHVHPQKNQQKNHKNKKIPEVSST
jgi:hypothetical protein